MTDKFCTGSVDDIDTFIKKCQFPPETFFLAERLPDHVVATAQERQNLLLFTHFNANIPFADYTSGRIFHRDFELRWEKNNGQAQMAYAGVEEHCPPTLDDSGLVLKKIEEPKYYYLFGERLNQQQLNKIGKPASEGDFAELRVPRLLRYPARQDEKRRVRLAVCEYVQETTGETEANGKVELFRFQGLEPAE